MTIDWQLLGFGDEGWGGVLLNAATVTVTVSLCAWLLGAILGSLLCWMQIGGSRWQQRLAGGYITLFRGVPELLVIYLFYFGGRQVVGFFGALLDLPGPFDVNGFVAGAIAIGLISGAYQSGVFRGAYHAIPKGTLEAATVTGMGRLMLFRRMIVPQALKTALPGMGNQWQSVIKESALVSVTGLVETMNQISTASNSTQMPFFFYSVGAVIYLIITTCSDFVFRYVEKVAMRGQQRARL
ncbi:MULTISPECIES: ABC transporter permease [Pantoea]|uniref:ABC transporter permease n=1 Tax=Pantoea cypripedii TaxID=55209 RepID=A0A1X1EFS4_PANCY|nr:MULTISPECIES: ABC transporter permease subunit [Pantoea]MBP2199435.1 octopine/nopaline transport system permease protein [Pantoea cypripedii]MDE1186631.1 ABC transporter permease subunit [Pantoea sp.]ORM87729.1 ABC transporter permease [Pantoea cypripedii]